MNDIDEAKPYSDKVSEHYRRLDVMMKDDEPVQKEAKLPPGWVLISGIILASVALLTLCYVTYQLFCGS